MIIESWEGGRSQSCDWKLLIVLLRHDTEYSAKVEIVKCRPSYCDLRVINQIWWRIVCIW